MRVVPRVAPLLALTALLLPAVAAAGDGRWSSTGRVSAVAADLEGRVYAVTAQGLWRSPEGGTGPARSFRRPEPRNATASAPREELSRGA